ncbi:MAG: LysR family transcriptional regulator, partial [Sphaerospermopsis sp. SIO1G2]|nr:LysR family transcriptional regulator [Sphaerospermopsis sp. SIO1G2]
HGSLAQAAQDLNLSASALSHQLSDLGKLLGQEVLDRRKRPPRFTAAGRRLLLLAEHCVPATDQALSDLAALKQDHRRRLHAALECHSCYRWLLPALRRYAQNSHPVDVDIRTDARFDPLPALADGIIDVVVATDERRMPGIHFAPLFRYEMVAVLAADHPLASKDRIDPQDLAGQTLISYPVPSCRLDIVNRFLEPAGVPLHQHRTTELTTMLLHQVALSDHFAALPAWAMTEADADLNLTTKPLGRGLMSRIWLAWRRDDPPYDLPVFIAAAQQSAADRLPGIELSDNQA